MTIKLKGDSRSSLKWGSSELFKGTLVHRASVVYMLLAVHTNVSVEAWEHIPGHLHVVCDALSRGVKPEELGFGASVIFRHGQDDVVDQLIAMCNPIGLASVRNEDDILSLWCDIRNLLRQL